MKEGGKRDRKKEGYGERFFHELDGNQART